MKKILILGVILSLSSLISMAQSEPVVIRDSIPLLDRPHQHLPKYVNYDVLKVMAGPGWAIPTGQDNGFSLIYNLQILCPFPNLKKLIPFAWGVNWGGSRFMVRKASIDFSGDKFNEIIDNPSVRSTAHRSGYVGFLIMPVIRANNFTFLTGAAVNYVFGSRLIIRDEGEVYRVSARKETSRFSYPLHLQVSFSMRQIASFGLNMSYDTKSKFKEAGTKPLHQTSVSFSGALIL
jgi:hypothetical protein